MRRAKMVEPAAQSVAAMAGAAIVAAQAATAEETESRGGGGGGDSKQRRTQATTAEIVDPWASVGAVAVARVANSAPWSVKKGNNMKRTTAGLGRGFWLWPIYG